MPETLTLIAPARDLPPEPISTVRVRPMTDADTAELGDLYFEAYDPGIASDTVEEAIADIEASFAGEYGPLLAEASLVAEDSDEIIGAVMTVERAPWPDTPECPFIIELFTARHWRRRSVARSLVIDAMSAVSAYGASHVALRVAANNEGALALYSSLGFAEWTPRD